MIFLRNRLIEVVTCDPSSAKKRVKRVWTEAIKARQEKVSTIDDMSAEQNQAG